MEIFAERFYFADSGQHAEPESSFLDITQGHTFPHPPQGLFVRVIVLLSYHETSNITAQDAPEGESNRQTGYKLSDIVIIRIS